ncbi:ORF6N domain-containing protein [Candidatus Parcubacteria bacterium]|nr:ORF6N domain-containing protein [Candidatus Parcubacteria bacterium]
MSDIISAEHIEHTILMIRGYKVILDNDLASLYGVDTKILNKAVRRNILRFPSDFMFQLTKEEYENLRFQFGTSSYGGRRYLPYVFTEYGVAMLSSVLRSERAILVNIEIMRTFGRFRRILSAHKGLAQRLDELEKKYDKRFRVVFEAIKELMEPSPDPKQNPIGFTP